MKTKIYLSLLSSSEFAKVKCPIQNSPQQPEPPKRLSFLTVNATTGNQALGHDRCNIFSGSS